MLNRLLTTPELAKILGVKPRWLEMRRMSTWKGSPGPPWIRIGNRVVRYDLEDVVLWLAERTEERGEE